MSYMEMKNAILFHYHKTIDFWFKLVGEMFEATDGFSNTGSLKRNLCGESCTIIWNSYEWAIDEPNKLHWNGLYWEKI